jgi:hypothetical protein
LLQFFPALNASSLPKFASTALTLNKKILTQRSDEAMICAGKNHYISIISVAKPKNFIVFALHVCLKVLHSYMAISA